MQDNALSIEKPSLRFGQVSRINEKQQFPAGYKKWLGILLALAVGTAIWQIPATDVLDGRAGWDSPWGAADHRDCRL